MKVCHRYCRAASFLSFAQHAPQAVSGMRRKNCRLLLQIFTEAFLSDVKAENAAALYFGDRSMFSLKGMMHLPRCMAVVS
ncbi:MAG: hypothetical protein LUH49_01890 [Cloacibacillus porcorum]|uniref:hypothetical protein n=1 Tax=Cloacibacillus porcorum TaxID=1197717 RepID=UPI0023F1E078|nr:hypothetical protein [Cloacibacillus porcorum]MCD7875713.1 hypothetical protein [Cloacibacillus porcorum]